MRFRWPHISVRTALGLLDVASCQPVAEALSSEAIKDTFLEADDDTAEKVEKSNEPAKADEPEHVEEHVEDLAGRVRIEKAVVDMGWSPKLLARLSITIAGVPCSSLVQILIASINRWISCIAPETTFRGRLMLPCTAESPSQSAKLNLHYI